MPARLPKRAIRSRIPKSTPSTSSSRSRSCVSMSTALARLPFAEHAASNGRLVARESRESVGLRDAITETLIREVVSGDLDLITAWFRVAPLVAPHGSPNVRYGSLADSLHSTTPENRLLSACAAGRVFEYTARRLTPS